MRTALLLAAYAVLTLVNGPALGQYPERPITMVVPGPPDP